MVSNATCMYRILHVPVCTGSTFRLRRKVHGCDRRATATSMMRYTVVAVLALCEYCFTFVEFTNTAARVFMIVTR